MSVEAAASAAAKRLDYGALKGLQLEVIKGIATGRDVFAVLPSYSTSHAFQNTLKHIITNSVGGLQTPSSASTLFQFEITLLRWIALVDGVLVLFLNQH